MTARTGKDYIERLKENPPETWIGNEKVTDPTTHPLVAPLVRSTAYLYDLQMDESKRDHMLYFDPETNRWEGTQFLLPKSQEDLRKRGKLHKEWADATYGMMGRSSDFMTAMLAAWYMNAEYFGEYADNIKNYFKYVRDNDLYLTHVLINPQVDRSQPPSRQPDEFTYLGVVKETDGGIIVRGAKMLATAGPYTDEVLVWPFANQKLNEEDYKYAISFAIPMNAPGLRCIAREPYTRVQSTYDFPLSSRFDELDGVLIFDDVFVPWERVFIYKDPNKINSLKELTATMTAHQTTIRLLSKMQFAAGVLMRGTEMIKINQFPHVQDQIGEITTYIELCRAAVAASEAGGRYNKNGFFVPDPRPLIAIRNSGNRWYPRIRQIFQRVLAGGVMYQPSAASQLLNGPLRADIEKYYRGADVSAKDKIKLFNVAAEIALNAFGSRHELYEQYYSGDPLFLRIDTQYKGYDKSECYELVDKLLASYDL